MCGIVGYWSRHMDGNRGQIFVDGACDMLRHRGPDQQAMVQRDGMGVGFVRLAILDLQTGMQPIIHPEDDTLIACNGQVYNYLELRQALRARRYTTNGDMEVALNAYRELDIPFLNRLNGMFAGMIHDPKRNRLLLFRDRFGIKPLYWTQNAFGFFYSSEIRPLLSAPGVSASLNHAALPAYFTYRYVPGIDTMFEGIYRLPPASYLDIDTRTGESSIKTYWEWSLCPSQDTMSFEDAQDEFVRLFEDAVRIRMRSDVEVGSFLSGGVDSSAVASAALTHHPHLHLFTVGFRESDYDETADVDALVHLMPERFSHSTRFVEYCEPHHLDMLPCLIEDMQEPVSIGTLLPTYRICQMASSKLKVVLTGEGADEIFAGYRKFRLEGAAMAWAEASSSQRQHLLKLFPELRARLARGTHDTFEVLHIDSERLFTGTELSHLLGKTDVSPHFLDTDLTASLHRAPDSLSAMQLLESRTRLPDYVNLRLDRMSMCHSLETRTPFLDVRLVEFAGSLPIHYRVNPLQDEGKVLCRAAFARHGILPKDVSQRPKLPFTIPLAQWFSAGTSLPEPIAEILNGREIERQGILDGDMVRSLAAKVAARGVAPDTLVSMGDRVFAIVVLSLWYNAFMKG